MPQAPAVGASVFWTPPVKMPAPLAQRLREAGFVIEPGEAVAVSVLGVHSARLVDVGVPTAEESLLPVRFVPFLHEGDPDPGSALGCAHGTPEKPRAIDPTAQHEIMEGRRPPGPTVGPDGKVLQDVPPVVPGGRVL